MARVRLPRHRLALAARAAAQLEKDAAIVSMTLDRLFNTLDTARISTDQQR